MIFMRSVLVFIVILQTCQMVRGNPFQQVYQYWNSCMTELKLNLDVSVQQRIPMPIDISNETKRLQKCILEKAGFIDRDGKIQEALWPRYSGVNFTECQLIKEEGDKCQEVHVKTLCMTDMGGPLGYVDSVKIYERAQYRNKCASESNLTMTPNFKIFGPGMRDPPREVKCLERCIMVKAGYLTEDNKMLRKKWTLGEGIDVGKCESIDHEDVCERSFSIHRCVQNEKLLYSEHRRQTAMGPRIFSLQTCPGCSMRQMRTDRRPTQLVTRVRGGPFQQVYQYSNSCITELKLNLNGSTPRRIPMHIDISNETKCLQKCMLEKAGFIGKDGKIQVELWPHYPGTNWTECQSIEEDDKYQEVHLKTLCMTDMGGPPLSMISVKGYEMAQYSNTCASELNLDMSKYRLFNPYTAPPGLRKPSKEVKCLERCIMIKAGYLTEDNKLLRKKWNLGDADVDGCASIDYEDVCEKSYAIRHCVQEKKIMNLLEHRRQRNSGLNH